MNYRTGKILLITSLLLLPAAFFPARGEEPAFSYTHIHREGSVSTMETGRVETREKSSKKTTHYDISVNLPSSPAAGGLLYPYLAKNGLPGDVHRRRGESDVYGYGVTAAFRNKKGWGLLNREGHEIVPAFWDSMSYEGNGLFQVKKGKKISYITADGRVAFPDREEGPSFYREKGKYGILDDRGNRVTAPLYREVLAPFSEGIAFVQLSDGRKGGIDGSRKLLFTAEFDSVGPYEDGLAEYRRKVNRFNWGTLAGAVLGGLGGSGGGDEMLPLSYDGVKRGYLDRQGRIVVDSRSDEVYPMTEWGTFVKDHGLLGFVNRKGEYIIPPGRYDLSGGMLYEEEGLVTLRDKEKERWVPSVWRTAGRSWISCMTGLHSSGKTACFMKWAVKRCFPEKAASFVSFPPAPSCSPIRKRGWPGWKRERKSMPWTGKERFCSPFRKERRRGLSDMAWHR